MAKKPNPILTTIVAGLAAQGGFARSLKESSCKHTLSAGGSELKVITNGEPLSWNEPITQVDVTSSLCVAQPGAANLTAATSTDFTSFTDPDNWLNEKDPSCPAGESVLGADSLTVNGNNVQLPAGQNNNVCVEGATSISRDTDNSHSSGSSRTTGGIHSSSAESSYSNESSYRSEEVATSAASPRASVPFPLNIAANFISAAGNGVSAAFSGIKAPQSRSFRQRYATHAHITGIDRAAGL